VRRIFAIVSLAAFTVTLAAQSPAPSPAKEKPAPTSAAASNPAVVKNLPVRKVVLYKNGVGYFEHAGSVTGNQRVAIDFTSPQLNDVLQSLTVLDEGGGHVSASTTTRRRRSPSSSNPFRWHERRPHLDRTLSGLARPARRGSRRTRGPITAACSPSKRAPRRQAKAIQRSISTTSR